MASVVTVDSFVKTLHDKLKIVADGSFKIQANIMFIYFMYICYM